MHPDPAGLAAVDPANPQSWNRYAYVLNNPLALIDPLGLADDGCDPSNNGDQPCPKNVTENDSGGMEGSGCAADGIAISCGWAWSLVYSGAAVPCPNNNCGPVSSQGQLWFFKISTNGNGAYFPVEGPGWNFASEAEALAAGALWAAAATRDNGIENCGMTYSTGNGQYSFTGSVEGHLASCQPLNASSLVPSGDPADGGYHSHPNDPNYYHERFSGQPGDYPGLGGDVGWAFSNNLPFGYPLSLGTPEGRAIIYYPAGNCQVFVKGSPVGTGTTIPICQ